MPLATETASVVMTLHEVEAVGGVRVERDHAFTTLGLLSDPQPGMLTFLESRKLLSLVRRTPELSCLITTPELAEELPGIPGLAIAANPRLAFFEFHNALACNTDYYWSDFPTEIDKTAKIHPRACVAERNVRIGFGSIVEANATISERCLIGDSVVVRAGAVLGSVGFQTGRFGDCVADMVHAGGVKIHNNVEIMSNAVIARGVFRQFTTIAKHVRIGNLAFVSHAVQVGPRSLIGHGAVVNGNVRIGADVTIGPGAVLVHCIEIGDRAQVSPGSAVIRSVPAGRRVTGNVAIQHRRYLRHLASVTR